jgi:hypothetical protein
MPDVHKEPDKILKALTSHSLRSGRAMTLMFLPDEFLCRGQVEFVDAKFLSVEVHDRMQAS